MSENKRIVCRMLDSGRITDQSGNDIDLSMCNEIQTKDGRFPVKNGVIKFKSNKKCKNSWKDSLKPCRSLLKKNNWSLIQRKLRNGMSLDISYRFERR